MSSPDRIESNSEITPEIRRQQIDAELTNIFIEKGVRKTSEKKEDGTPYSALDVIDHHVVVFSKDSKEPITRVDVAMRIVEAYEFDRPCSLKIGYALRQIEELDNAVNNPE